MLQSKHLILFGMSYAGKQVKLCLRIMLEVPMCIIVVVLAEFDNGAFASVSLTYGGRCLHVCKSPAHGCSLYEIHQGESRGIRRKREGGVVPNGYLGATRDLKLPGNCCARVAAHALYCTEGVGKGKER